MMIRFGIAGCFTAAAALFWITGDLHEQSALDSGAITLATVAATADPRQEAHLSAVTTTTTTTTTTVPPIIYPPAPEGARCPQWWEMAQLAGFTYDELEHALDRIMWRESRCRPEVRSSTSDTGLLQINDIHLPWLAEHYITREMLFDPWWNLVAGRMVADQALAYGWRWTQPWSATFP